MCHRQRQEPECSQATESPSNVTAAPVPAPGPFLPRREPACGRAMCNASRRLSSRREQKHSRAAAPARLPCSPPRTAGTAAKPGGTVLTGRGDPKNSPGRPAHSRTFVHITLTATWRAAASRSRWCPGPRDAAGDAKAPQRAEGDAARPAWQLSLPNATPELREIHPGPRHSFAHLLWALRRASDHTRPRPRCHLRVPARGRSGELSSPSAACWLARAPPPPARGRGSQMQKDF